MSTRFWLAVASYAHVRIGQAQGFMQVCHGKAAPLRRLSHLDHVVYYSPTETFGGKDRVQAFTAYGLVSANAPYQAHMGGDFYPFRQDVQWHSAKPAPIAPLLQTMQWSAGQSNWGYMLRRGIFEITAHDMHCIATAMQVDWNTLTPHHPCNDVQLEMAWI